MKKGVSLSFIFFLALLLVVPSTLAIECSATDQTMFKLSQKHEALGSVWNSEYPHRGVYGDVDLDGEAATVRDVTMLSNYLTRGDEIPLWGEIFADVNLDGTVTAADMIGLSMYFWGARDSLPYYTSVSESTVDVVWGDVNLDGVVTTADYELLDSHLNGGAALSELAYLQANVNFDDRLVTIEDYNTLFAAIGFGAPDTLPYYDGEWLNGNVLFGDVNGDGVVGDSEDLEAYGNWLLRGSFFPVGPGYGEIIADVNLDGNINAADVVTMKHLSYADRQRLPYDAFPSSIEVDESEVIWGDADTDGDVDADDVAAIQAYIDGGTLPRWGIVTADVNLDGVVDFTDRDILDLLYISGSLSSLPIMAPYNDPINDWYASASERTATDVCYDEVFGGTYAGSDPHTCTYEFISEVLVDCGDVNGDRRISQTDAVLIEREVLLNQVLAAFTHPENCDVNGDGRCTLVDSNIVLGSSLIPSTANITNDCGAMQCGDVNGNGAATQTDAVLIERYVRLNTESLKGNYRIPENCDVNGDGNCNMTDSEIVLKSTLSPPTATITKQCPQVSFTNGLFNLQRPATSLGSIDQALGDYNNDGVITEEEIERVTRFVSGQEDPSLLEEFLADLNQDETLDGLDSQIAEQLSDQGIGKLDTYTKNYSSVDVVWGDVNVDGVVDLDDLSDLLSYLNEATLLPKWGETAADVRLDGVIDIKDYLLIAFYLTDLRDGTSPTFPIPDHINGSGSAFWYHGLDPQFGDVDNDEDVDLADLFEYLAYLKHSTPFSSTMGNVTGDVNLDGLIDENDFFIAADHVLNGKYSSGLPVFSEVSVYNESLSFSGVPYNVPICYGDLRCEYEPVDNFDSSSTKYACSNGGEIVAWMRDTHGSLISTGDTRLEAGESGIVDAWGHGDIKVCCTSASAPTAPLGPAYWTNTHGEPITVADLGDTVFMVVPGEASRAASAVFEIEEIDGWQDKDAIRTIFGAQVNGDDAEGNWSIIRSDIEKSEDYDHFVFKEDTFNVQSGDLRVNPTVDDDPIRVEITSHTCAEVLAPGLQTITVSAVDRDDVISGFLRVSGVDSNGEVIPAASIPAPILLENGEASLTFDFRIPGSYSFVAFGENGNLKSGSDIVNVMIIDDSVDGEYISSCIDSPADASNIPASQEAIVFNASSTTGFIVKSGSREQVPRENIYFSWEFSDRETDQGFNHYMFSKKIQSVGPGWARLTVSLGEGVFEELCIDTDGGQDFSVQGIVRDYVPAEQGVGFKDSDADRCLSPSKLHEVYCEDNAKQSVSVDCPAGTTCADGACV